MGMVIPLKPVSDDFAPTLDISKRRVVIDGHRIATRIARWDDIHAGISGRVRSPRSVNLDAAHIGVTDLADGTSIETAVLPMHTTHAAPDKSALHAASWYENSGTAVARVRYSVDDEGIRADGVLFPDITEEQVTRIKAGAPSGDWRVAAMIRTPDDMEHAHADFAGACIVNVPGFSQKYSNFAGRTMKLAASAAGTDIYVEDDVADDNTKPADCDGSCTPCTCGKGGAPDGTPAETPGGDAASLTAAAHDENGATYTVPEVIARMEALERVVAQIVMGGFR